MLSQYFWYAAFAMLIGNLSTASAHELGAHVHGIATLQVAVDEKTVTLDFSSPLDNLLGFEHLPRDDKQKAAVKSMAESLNKAELLFIPTTDAQCTLQSVKLDSLVLNSKSTQDKEEAGGHADLDGEFVFTCKQSGKLHDLEVKLFDTFPNLHQIKVEVATLKKQASAKLTPEQRHVNW
jgi:hypothetical protein